jgi:hypothetical protein
MMTRRLKLGLALFVGLVAGILAGVVYAKQTIGTTFGWMSQWAAVGTYAQLANLEYQYADESHGRAALSDFLNFAEKLKAEGNATDVKALEIDVARTYVRLAVLDRHAGNTAGYQSDLSSAQAALRAAGSPHASAEDVERSVNQLESHQ